VISDRFLQMGLVGSQKISQLLGGGNANSVTRRETTKDGAGFGFASQEKNDARFGQAAKGRHALIALYHALRGGRNLRRARAFFVDK
jgi:hypothetical protein